MLILASLAVDPSIWRDDRSKAGKPIDHLQVSRANDDVGMAVLIPMSRLVEYLSLL